MRGNPHMRVWWEDGSSSYFAPEERASLTRDYQEERRLDSLLPLEISILIILKMLLQDPSTTLKKLHRQLCCKTQE